MLEMFVLIYHNCASSPLQQQHTSATASLSLSRPAVGFRPTSASNSKTANRYSCATCPLVACLSCRAGKGTQCDLIVKHYGWAHFSAGDLLRAQVKAGTEMVRSHKPQAQLVLILLLSQLIFQSICHRCSRCILCAPWTLQVLCYPLACCLEAVMFDRSTPVCALLLLQGKQAEEYLKAGTMVPASMIIGAHA